MSENSQEKVESVPPPHAQLIEMCTAYWVSKVVYAAAKLGLVDHLAEAPKSAADLAGATGTHAPSLHRLIRTLASFWVFSAKVMHKCFALTPEVDPRDWTMIVEVKEIFSVL